ncbi:tRNA 2-thiouridine(34) synthase MnmA [Candidatus Ishikawella capsulata]|uniref:tRNA-specific 2-thiouridylase MnmA n=1 Tax=Candidatus Ishikawaella capsulata Mpkobe TaxID=476281 RepID=C5WD04_9ENTR|nr:tRNA 2-thiouridine(34) synthase MnmA [Candidatus Ishikawaella capsulata]BAH83210.1 tRNA (5-methylaminomethyl-2-thiouridylate)-methyltransferase [Candidatus Ishikawaella capsulata Mpkobe]
MKKVIVGMSGGVDSSVSAWLLKQQGYQVEGVFMKNWEEDDTKDFCNSAKDLVDAQLVCDKIGINLKTVNFSAEYWEYVFKIFLDEYKNGQTPNPDILCNKEIKFKVFLNFSQCILKADYIATGHYVRIQTKQGKKYLLRGIDNKKDQSYFLYTLTHKQLEKILFPLGDKKKSEVRNIAVALDLPIANKKDSVGMCFIGKRKFREFLKRYIPINPGVIETIDGKIIGQHEGIMYYTIGQRRGLCIGGIKNNPNSNPWYVVDKDVIYNRLIVTQDSNDSHLMSNGVIAHKIHWIDGRRLTKDIYCSLKTRYQETDTLCKISPINEDTIAVYFNEPIRAVTPGQSAVFYVGEICIGGGIIKNRIP